jgi:hypothetical protein
MVWFNWDVDGMDWRIESSKAARAAFARGLRSRYFAAKTAPTLLRPPVGAAKRGTDRGWRRGAATGPRS